jgi:nucleoside-diphosphate-sugar epimerase
MKKILVTGAAGQIGTELTCALRKLHGAENILATDIKFPMQANLQDGPFALLDATDGNTLMNLVRYHNIGQVYHLSAMLSATGEQFPRKGWDLNMQSLLNVLEIAKEAKLEKVFWPSSIAVFGKGATMMNCGQHEPQRPSTVYGISKSAGESWCSYYGEKYGIDIRSLRYPGLISYKTTPGGGTTDYAVDIYYKAIAERSYTCYLKAGTRLPMMYMDDAIRATLELMDADASKLRVRTSYNLAAVSFTPEEVAAQIQQKIPDFTIRYEPDFRQQIADSWPASINDHCARRDWGWKHEFGLEAITRNMLVHLSSLFLSEYGVS